MMIRSGIMRLQEGGSPWYINIFGTKGEGETAEEKARREFLEKWFEEHSLAVPVGEGTYDPFAGDPEKEFELWLVYDELFPGTVPDPTSTDTNGADTNGADTSTNGTPPKEGEKKTVTNPDGTTTEYEFKDGKWVQIAAGLF